MSGPLWDALAVFGGLCLIGLVAFGLTVAILERRENTGLVAEIRDHQRYVSALRRATRRG